MRNSEFSDFHYKVIIVYLCWYRKAQWDNIFTYESSYCFQRDLAITVCSSVSSSVCHTGGSVKSGAS